VQDLDKPIVTGKNIDAAGAGASSISPGWLTQLNLLWGGKGVSVCVSIETVSSYEQGKATAAAEIAAGEAVGEEQRQEDQQDSKRISRTAGGSAGHGPTALLAVGGQGSKKDVCNSVVGSTKGVSAEAVSMMQPLMYWSTGIEAQELTAGC
jgi:hypothetical protein